MNMEKTVKTYILCHDQNFIVESIKNKKYDHFINYYFVFMGMGDTNNIDELENVIFCKNLDNNIEIQKNCLQYCGWYGLYYNNLIDTDYIRIIDYDLEINDYDNTTESKVKSGIGFSYDFYFIDGFGNSQKFIDISNKQIGKDISAMISEYESKYQQNKWFSSIDVLIDKETFSGFMDWLFPIYEETKDEFYFGMFFERFLTIFLMYKEIEYTISEGKVSHKQLKSHIYY